MIDPRELRIGNWFIGYDNKPFQFDYTDFMIIGHPTQWEQIPFDPDELIKSPIPLTEEILLKCGCKNIPHKVFTSNYELPLKRNKSLYITDVGTPNFMVGIIERDFETNQIEDCVNIHNFDFEKEMYLHQLQNLYFALTGQELEIKP